MRVPAVKLVAHEGMAAWPCEAGDFGISIMGQYVGPVHESESVGIQTLGRPWNPGVPALAFVYQFPS
jgi:hypothetical protein